jgi:hypothetical protein
VLLIAAGLVIGARAFIKGRKEETPVTVIDVKPSDEADENV